MSLQRSIYYNNSIRSPYRLDVIGKVLKAKNAGNISINKNSNNAGISRSLINKEINFSICKSHSSIYSTTNSIPRINCSCTILYSICKVAYSDEVVVESPDGGPINEPVFYRYLMLL